MFASSHCLNKFQYVFLLYQVAVFTFIITLTPMVIIIKECEPEVSKHLAISIVWWKPLVTAKSSKSGTLLRSDSQWISLPVVRILQFIEGIVFSSMLTHSLACIHTVGVGEVKAEIRKEFYL